MISEIWMRRVTQATLSTALAAALVGMAWYSSSKNRTAEEDASVGGQAMVPSDALDAEAASASSPSETRSMPACVDLQQALDGLDQARAALLREAAAGDSETAAQAVQGYRQAVEAVRQNAERLRSRSMPDEYRSLWQALTSNRNDERGDESGLAEVELGILSVGSRP